jgi:hypothetical protein
MTKPIEPTIISSDKITKQDLEGIDFDHVVYVETGGRMGMEGTMTYELDGDKFILYRTESYDDKSELDTLARNLISKYVSEENFNEYRGGFGNSPRVRKGLTLIPATKIENIEDEMTKRKENGAYYYWIINQNGKEYKIEPSVDGVYINAQFEMAEESEQDQFSHRDSTANDKKAS